MKELTFTDRVLIRMAGQDPDTVSKCGADEIIRVKIRGRSILVPTILAFIGAFILVYTESSNYLFAILGGVAWMTIVYINDNSIMATGDGRKFSFPVLLRVVLAILTALIFGEGILILLFHDAIKEQQHEEIQAQVLSIDSMYDPQLLVLKEEWKVAKNELWMKERDYVTETDGTGGSEERGDGKIAKIKLGVLNKERAEYSADSMRIARRMDKVEQERETKYEAVRDAQAKGAAGSLGALNRIHDKYISWAIWIIRCALLLVDLIPFFIKYSSSKPWDLYNQLVTLESQSIRDMALISRKMEEQVMKEKKSYIATEAKIKAGYDHRLHEMDMFEDFMKEAAERWEQHMEYLSKHAPAEFMKSRNAEKVRNEFDEMWQEKVKPAA